MIRIPIKTADDLFFFKLSLSQVSYIIVDGADSDVEMANDPFPEIGIDMPKELQYGRAQLKRRGSC